MSESNLVSIKIVPEESYGSTPSQSTYWKYQRFTDESLAVDVVIQESNEIRSDRNLTSNYISSKSIKGGMSFELSPTTYDNLIRAAIPDYQPRNGLLIGSDIPSYSIEKHYEDTDDFVLLKGMRVNQMNLDITYGEIISGNFQFLGSGFEARLNSSANTVQPATKTSVFTSVEDVGQVDIAGVSTGIIIRSLTLNVDNNLRENRGVGSEYSKDVRYGSASVTGSVELYLSGDTYEIYKDHVLNNSSVSLSYTIDDGVDSYSFVLPSVRLSGETPSSADSDDDVILTLNYVALRDKVTGKSLIYDFKKYGVSTIPSYSWYQYFYNAL